MAEAVLMPRQGQSVETCVITEWLKKKGEEVEEGDLLFSYETDKAAFDEAAPVSGTLLEILFDEGDEVPVLETVAVIGNPGEDFSGILEGSDADASGAAAAGVKGTKEDPEEAVSRGGARATAGATDTKDEPAEAGNEGGAGGANSSEGTDDPVSVKSPVQGTAYETGIQHKASKIRISPRAKKMAEAMQIDFTHVKGSGPNGRIIADDITAAARSGEAAAQQSKPTVATSVTGIPSPASTTSPAADTTFTDQPLSNIRKIIATNMKASLDNSAQLTHHASSDARNILSLRKAIKEGTEQRLPATTTLNDMVCYAIIQALKETPEMNAHFLGDKIRSFTGVHLGMAVDTPRGLMVPALRNADRYTLGGLGQSLREMAESCKNGTVDPDQLAPEAGSFTVSNLGAYGIEMFTPVLNLPQCGIIGVNTITPRPVDLGEGTMGFVPHIGISLTYDHRAVDGAPASRFLQKVCHLIAEFDPKL